MSFKFIALALPLTLFSPAYAAETAPLEKNGLPCVEELCLGDSLAQLSKIKWLPAESPVKVNNKAVLTAARQMSDSDLLMLRSTFPDPSQAGPYFYNKQFDEAALPGLTRTMAACESHELFGTFISPNGSTTKVGVSLLPVTTDPARQAWTVTTIARDFPGTANNQERSVVNEELKKRYFKFGASNPDVGNPKPGEGRFYANGLSRAGFALSVVRANDETKRMKLHPSCSGK